MANMNKNPAPNTLTSKQARPILLYLTTAACLLLLISFYHWFKGYNEGRLFDCIEKNDLQGVETCLKLGASAIKVESTYRLAPGEVHKYTTYPLASATQVGNAAIMESLLRHGATTQLPTDSTPLLLRLNRGNVKAIKLLLKHGADPNGDYRTHGNTCLDQYCKQSGDELDGLQLLLDYGASVNGINNEGFALHSAINELSYPTIKFLLSHGAKLNARNKNDWLLTHVLNDIFQCDDPRRFEKRPVQALEASKSRKRREDVFEVAAYLLSAGIDPNKVDQDGNSALHLTTINKNPLTTKLLLSHQKNPSLKNHRRETPLSIARKNGYVEIVKILEQAGVKV